MNEDAGSYYTSHRCRLQYLASLVCLLANCDVWEITGPIDTTLSPDQIFRALGDVMLVLLYILSDNEMFRLEKLRLGMWLPFRLMHSMRLSADRHSGAQSSKVAFDFRVSYACGRWQQDVRNIMQSMSGPINQRTLLDWHVLERCERDFRVTKLYKTREILGRVFSAQRCMTTAVWDGMIYVFGRFFSSSVQVVAQEVANTKRLFLQLIAYENKIASDDCPVEIQHFDATFVWRHNTVWREIIAYVARFGLDFVLLTRLRNMFETYYHSWGIENTFKWLACSHITG